eukprot:TRINITY_DN78041_c0_g1_i1.p2 TRINITY_DN78041_c0_g1~~TRINITY_DN78041_c0_g1_i1.p2  ORF type:complete len:149 (-),score=45.24 TRINITY_DN78041_c0_g1_i1:23-469(-)
MVFVDAQLVLAVTYGYGACVFGGGLYGYISAGSKVSAIASTICALVAVGLAAVQGDISPWPAAIWCLLLPGLFGKKAFGKKKQSMCPVHNDTMQAMTEEKRADPMSRYTRMEEGGGDGGEKGGAGKSIMVLLTAYSVVEVVLLAQLGF